MAHSSFIRRYIFSTDHKTIAKQYLFLALFMALAGGSMAYLMRWQLAWPETPVPGWGYLKPEFYNALVTLHGTIMIFFVAMPLLLGAFGNFCIPLMVGAKNMAFPRLSMVSFWTFFTGSLLLLVSFFVEGGAASAGWTGYAPLSATPIYTGVYLGLDLWIVALALEFAAFLMGGINFLATTVLLRAPGLSLWRLPLFVWFQCIAAALFMLSVGPLIAGILMLLMDRRFAAGFFLPEGGGDPLLWQHLFWFFGHPEVYVIVLPGLAAALEIFPVFARKPVFGYRAIIWSALAAGALSFIVWAHHMFISGIDFRLALPFSITTILIAVPFAIIMLALIATLWRGSIRLDTPMLWAVGFVATFIIGGVTGIFLGSAALNIYLHDTYFVVAHFHYTLFPAVLFGGFACLSYWFPKMFGRHLNEALGKTHCVLTFIFFNLTFLPMFLIGTGGQVRRLYDPTAYNYLVPHQPLNEFATWMALALMASQFIFIVNFFYSIFAGRRATDNPWGANTLEWATTSPPPHGNFASAPTVHRGPYEYSVPGRATDWWPQHAPEEPPA